MVHNPEHDQHTGILAWWAKNSVAANLLMLIALIGGVVGYFSMQRENNPGAVFPVASISVAWPGASPQEIEEQIKTFEDEVQSGVFEEIGSLNRERAKQFQNDLMKQIQELEKKNKDAIKKLKEEQE